MIKATHFNRKTGSLVRACQQVERDKHGQIRIGYRAIKKG